MQRSCVKKYILLSCFDDASLDKLDSDAIVSILKQELFNSAYSLAINWLENRSAKNRGTLHDINTEISTHINNLGINLCSNWSDQISQSV